MVNKAGIGIGIVLLIAFLMFNAQGFFGTYADSAINQLTIYSLVLVLILSTLKVRLPAVSLGSKGVRNFIIGFVGTAFLMLLVPDGYFTAYASQLKYGILFVFIKAFLEEVIFRDLLPNKAGFGYFYSNILFGVFHATMLSASAGATWLSVFLGSSMLVILGFAWTELRKQFGLMSAVGSHFAYNLAIFGMLKMLFGV